MSPQRIQLRRVKGWRKPKGAIVVARPSKWGNPFHVGAPHPDHGWPMSRQETVDLYRRLIEKRGITAVGGVFTWQASRDFMQIARTELAGFDLCCWCAIDAPCHADVLLEIANSGAGQPAERTTE